MSSLAEMMAANNAMYSGPSVLDIVRGGNAARMEHLQAREYEDQLARNQQLREMFGRAQGNPSVAEIGAIDPKMAMGYSAAQAKLAEQMLGMQKTRGEISKLQQDTGLSKAKAFAEATGPFADQYEVDVQMGMPPEQALMKFRQGIGGAISQLNDSGLSPDVPINIDNLQPEQLLNAAVGHGYQSRFQRQQEAVAREQQISQLPPRANAPQPEPWNYQHPGVHVTPEGYAVPIPPAAQAEVQQVTPQQFEGQPQAMGPQDVDNLRAIYQQLPTGPEKDRAGKMLAEVIKQQMRPQGQPQAAPGFVSPQQIQQERAAQEVETTRQKEMAKAEVGQKAAAVQEANLISALPSVKEIEKEIDKSISSETSRLIKEEALGKGLGISTDAAQASAKLKIIDSQLRSITRHIYEGGAISNYEQQLMAQAAGDISSAKAAAVRKAALKEFMRILQGALSKHPEAAMELELGKKRRMRTDEEALKNDERDSDINWDD